MTSLTATTYLDSVESFLAVRQRTILKMLPMQATKPLTEEGSIELLRVGRGQNIFRRENAKDLHIVIKGVVSLLERAQTKADSANVCREMEFIELDVTLHGDSSFKYIWQAETDVEVLVIDGERFRNALTGSPDLLNFLIKTSLNKNLQHLVMDLRLVGFPEATTMKIIASMDPVRFEKKAEQEALPPGLYLMDDAEAEVFGISEKVAQQSLSNFVAGHYFLTMKQDFKLSIEVHTAGSVWFIPEATWDTIVPTNLSRQFQSISDFAAQRFHDIAKNAIGDKNSPSLLDYQLPSFNTVDADDETAVDDFYLPKYAGLKKSLRPKLALQRDQMDCGAACLSAVARYYKRNIDVAEFRRLLNVSREGASLLDMQKAARVVGFRSLGISCDLGNTGELGLPAVAMLQNHYVVVYEVGEKLVSIADPAIGLRKVLRADLEKEYGGFLLLLRPTEQLYEYPESRPSILSYLKIFEGQRYFLFLTVIMSVVAFIFNLAMPFGSQFIFDELVVKGNKDLLLLVVIFSVVAAFMSLIIAITRAYLVSYFTTLVDAKLIGLFVNKLLSLPASFFAQRHNADFTMRLGELQNIRAYLSHTPVSLLLDIMSVAIYGTVIAIYSVYLLGIIGLCLPLMIGLVMVTAPIFKRYSERSFKQAIRESGIFYEQVKSISTIKALGMTTAARWRWEFANTAALKLGIEAQKVSEVITMVRSALANVISTLILVVSLYLYLKNQLSLGQVVAISALTVQVLQPAVRIIGEIKNAQQILLSFGRIDDIFNANSEGISGNSYLERMKGEIELRDVSFRYGSDISPLVLQNISLRIPSGKTVAFVGASGSGKTTLALMISSLYEPTSGSVLVDGHDIRVFERAWYRRQTALILQENSLIHGTIMENICLGDKDPSFGKVVEAARGAEAHDFILKMADGYATKISANVSPLSGGQKQRVCIARALYLNPPILIMDEATSALDAHTESAIMDRVRERKEKGLTTIIVAHRLNTVMSADLIVVFARGSIVEMGTHEDLMGSQGQYFHFFRKQVSA